MEMFFDPQTHTDRGVPFETVVNGIWRATQDAAVKFDIKSQLIMCFLRHLTEEAAIKTLEASSPHRAKILGVGLDSGEKGNPPEKFKNVFKRSKELGYRLVAHAGEEGGPENIACCVNELKVERIDHGVRAIDSPEMMAELATKKIPLTCCPLSNVKLRVFDKIEDCVAAMRVLVENNVMVTVNSDDPSYFGGYTLDCYMA